MMVRRAATLAAFSLLAFAAPAQAPGQLGGDFADAPEKPFVTETCTACHVAAQVTGQRRSKEDWAAIIDKMIGFGAKVPDDKFDPLLAYLTQHYGDSATAK